MRTVSFLVNGIVRATGGSSCPTICFSSNDRIVCQAEEPELLIYLPSEQPSSKCAQISDSSALNGTETHSLDCRSDLVNNNEEHTKTTTEVAGIIRTSDCYVSEHEDIYKVPTVTGRHGYKQLARKQSVKIEPEQNYSPGEVAAALNLSYDAALRLMLKMKGVIDFGTPTRRYKRGKRKMRISGKNLLAFLRSKTRG